VLAHTIGITSVVSCESKEAPVPDETVAPVVVAEPELDTEELAAEVTTQPEDDDPLALAGEPADPPADTGRPEGVGP